jgi:hypothetical protein
MKTKMPKDFDTMKIVRPIKDSNIHVVNSQGAIMNSFLHLKDAEIWRDHFFNGYYSSCIIIDKSNNSI